MSDTCYLQINIQNDDISKLCKVLGWNNGDLPFDEEEAVSKSVVVGRAYEANWGWCDQLQELGEQDVPFYGYHGAGGSYAAEVFVAFEGEYIVMYAIDSEGITPVIPIENGSVAPMDLEKSKKYEELLQKVKQLFEEKKVG